MEKFKSQKESLNNPPENNKEINETTYYIESAQWGKEDPTEQTIYLNYLLKTLGEKEGEIIDAGAGFGRNSIYLAEQGYSIKAVEKDSGAIDDLNQNITEHKLEEKISVLNESIQDTLKNTSGSSILAIIDIGMSHYLNDEEKREYAKEVLRCLKRGGIFTFLHFSENEDSAPKMGRTKEFLKGIFSEEDFDTIREWEEHKWEYKERGDKHSAWITTLRKKGGELITAKQLKKVEEAKEFERLEKEKLLKALGEIFDEVQGFKKTDKTIGNETKEKIVDHLKNNPIIIEYSNYVEDVISVASRSNSKEEFIKKLEEKYRGIVIEQIRKRVDSGN